MRLSALTVLLVAAPALAQTAVRPGDAVLDPSVVQAGEQRYIVRLTAPMRQDIGTVVETTTIDGGRITRVVRLDVPMAGQTETDSSVAVWPGLAPVFSSADGRGAGVETATFADGQATTRVTAADGTSRDSTVVLAEPVFGSGWGADIVQMLPLAAGYSATFTALDANEGLLTTTVTVTGSETAVTPAGPVEAWTVESVRGRTTTTYAIAKDSRTLLAVRFSPQPGAEVEVVPAP